EFGTTDTEIAKPERNVGIFGIKFGQQPCASGIRREDFDDRQEIRLGVALFIELLAKLPVAKQPFADVFRQELGSHHRPPLMSGAKQASAASWQAVKSMCRAMQKCRRSVRRSMTASSLPARSSPRAHEADLRARRAVVIRCAFGLEDSDIKFDDIGCFLSWWFTMRKEKAGPE